MVGGGKIRGEGDARKLAYRFRSRSTAPRKLHFRLLARRTGVPDISLCHLRWINKGTRLCRAPTGNALKLRPLQLPKEAAARGVSRAQNRDGSPSRCFPGGDATLGSRVRQQLAVQKAGDSTLVAARLLAGSTVESDGRLALPRNGVPCPGLLVCRRTSPGDIPASQSSAFGGG